MNLLSQYIEFVEKNNLFVKSDRLLITVSGGVDSIVLCELCHQSGIDFVMAHCNFQLRGKDSEDDELLVRKLAEKYNVELKIAKFETTKYAAENNVNIQIAARNLRYNWFNEILESEKTNPIKYILTAHHANDNVETLLMNFFKGTGIKGLQGILAKDAGIGGRIVRPLLFAKKEALIEFANDNKLEWREDVSNESNKYTRNYFRNELLPGIKKVFPQADENLMDNIARFNDANVIYENAINQIKNKLIEIKGSEIQIPVLKLLKTPGLKTVMYELLKDYGFTANQVPDAVKLLNAESGKYIASSTHRLIRNRQWLILTALEVSNSSLFLIEENDKEINFTGNKIIIEKTIAPSTTITDNSIAHIDNSVIVYPLILRKWKQGDYFYPLGMDKKKKLSRFFSDKKMSLTEKENVWVIESNKKIIWVVGHRIDNRCRITDTTKSVTKFLLIPSK